MYILITDLVKSIYFNRKLNSPREDKKFLSLKYGCNKFVVPNLLIACNCKQ